MVRATGGPTGFHTVHWMLDRGLISLSDDLDALIFRHATDPDGVRAFIARSGRAIAPKRVADGAIRIGPADDVRATLQRLLRAACKATADPPQAHRTAAEGRSALETAAQLQQEQPASSDSRRCCLRHRVTVRRWVLTPCLPRNEFGIHCAVIPASRSPRAVGRDSADRHRATERASLQDHQDRLILISESAIIRGQPYPSPGFSARPRTGGQLGWSSPGLCMTS